MNPIYPPKGLIIPMVTPCDGKGRIDWDSFERLMERILPLADGLCVGESLVGEGLWLPPPLRQELLSGALRLLAGRKPLFLCATGATEAETLSGIEEITAQAVRASIESQIFWVDLPLWYHSNRKLPQLYEEWKRRTPFPILLSNQPTVIALRGKTLKRRNIRTSILKRLVENEQIVGLLYTGGLKRAMDYQRAVRQRRDFLFYDGEERSFLNQPSASGVVAPGANLLPSEWREIVQASLHLCEDPVQNLRVFQQSQNLRILSQILREGPAGMLKQALHRLGILSEAKLWTSNAGPSAAGSAALDRFLRENLSLRDAR
jgi:dihydrodipicolinate synthase/N-acetylneuraminate lyase